MCVLAYVSSRSCGLACGPLACVWRAPGRGRARVGVSAWAGRAGARRDAGRYPGGLFGVQLAGLSCVSRHGLMCAYSWRDTPGVYASVKLMTLA